MTLVDENDWTAFLHAFGSANKGRATRLGVFVTIDGASDDLWLEDGLPLLALDAYAVDAGKRIDIVLENFTHSIDRASLVMQVDGGLDIRDDGGVTTVLRFEDWENSNEG